MTGGGTFKKRLAGTFKSAGKTAVVLGLATGPVSAAAVATPTLSGTWLTPDKAVVEISRCDTGFCGHIIDFQPPPGYTRASTRDKNNRDASKRNRKILGLKIVWNTMDLGQGWRARVYDPRRGFSVDAELNQPTSQSLVLRGCVRVLIKICETETWHRLR